LLSEGVPPAAVTEAYPMIDTPRRIGMITAIATTAFLLVKVAPKTRILSN
jgi:hypothetical protein